MSKILLEKGSLDTAEKCVRGALCLVYRMKCNNEGVVFGWSYYFHVEKKAIKIRKSTIGDYYLL